MAENKIDFEMVLSKAITIPMVRIDRDSFLRTELRGHFPAKQVERAIRTNPAQAGIAVEKIDKIANGCINAETLKVSVISFAAGIPGGWAMVGTIPADVTQYMGHVLRIAQKLIYLYGWDDLLNDDNSIDDTAKTILILFIGVMFGVSGASTVIAKIAERAGENVAKELIQKALTKGVIYPIVKKIAQIIGAQMTKEIFAKGVSKIVPVIGGVASGGLTLATYKPMAHRLQKHLRGLNQANVDYYANGDSIKKTIDDEIDFSDVIIEDED